MSVQPYASASILGPPTASQMANAQLLTFTPETNPAYTWDAYAMASDSGAYSSGFFKIDLIQGEKYDFVSESFFEPFFLTIYDKNGNALPAKLTTNGRDSEYIDDFVAPYTGTYYIDASWHKGAYHTTGYISVYEFKHHNQAPVAASIFQSLSWTEGSIAQYTVPAFTDPDGDTLTYSATQTSGQALPSWLTFNAATRTFTGTPPVDASDVAITIVAKDPGGLSAQGNLTISTPVVVPSTVAMVAAAAILRTTGAQDPQVADVVSKAQQGALSASAVVAQMLTLAHATTSVASMSYEFFTGKVPSYGGIDFLVSPTGPNANNLNSAYYQRFSLENRYINFAVNLGKFGEGKAQFEAKYGSLSFFDATREAYKTIFGGTPTDAKIHALIDTRIDYFASYGGDGATGLGTKAAMVGWLLAEAVKADVGVMAKSNDAWLTDLSDGTAPYAVDILDPAKGYYKAEFVFGGG